MLKKGILMGLGLYLALFLAGMAFNACNKTKEKSSAEKLAPILLLSSLQQVSYFITIPPGMAH